MTHSELVLRAEKWLYGTLRCGYVIVEKKSSAAEVPDALGLREWYTILIECKASRQDFLKDKKKKFRSDESAGMGDFRYYLVPDGMVQIEEIPDGWGLLYAKPKTIKVVKKVYFGYKGNRYETSINKNMIAEFMVMYTTLREYGYLREFIGEEKWKKFKERWIF